jgi:hypothetical protein
VPLDRRLHRVEGAAEAGDVVDGDALATPDVVNREFGFRRQIVQGVLQQRGDGPAADALPRAVEVGRSGDVLVGGDALVGSDTFLRTGGFGLTCFVFLAKRGRCSNTGRFPESAKPCFVGIIISQV